MTNEDTGGGAVARADRMRRRDGAVRRTRRVTVWVAAGATALSAVAATVFGTTAAASTSDTSSSSDSAPSGSTTSDGTSSDGTSSDGTSDTGGFGSAHAPGYSDAGGSAHTRSGAS